MYGNCPDCRTKYGNNGITEYLPCYHMLKKFKDQLEGKKEKEKVKWSRKGEQGTAYRRQFPDSAYHRIVTKKAKFFGQLMYCVLVAGGAPGWFRPYNLRNITMESIMDSLLPNSVNFHITYDGPKENENCPDCGSKDKENKGVSNSIHRYCRCLNCDTCYPKYKGYKRR